MLLVTNGGPRPMLLSAGKVTSCSHVPNCTECSQLESCVLNRTMPQTPILLHFVYTFM